MEEEERKFDAKLPSSALERVLQLWKGVYGGILAKQDFVCRREVSENGTGTRHDNERHIYALQLPLEVYQTQARRDTHQA